MNCTCVDLGMIPNDDGTFFTETERTMAEETGLSVDYVHNFMDYWVTVAERFL